MRSRRTILRDASQAALLSLLLAALLLCHASGGAAQAAAPAGPQLLWKLEQGPIVRQAVFSPDGSCWRARVTTTW